MNIEVINQLREKQKELDDFIISNNNIDVEKIRDRRTLAFIIEVCEFLNEEKSFKYWKKDHTVDRGKLVEEYIDGIHFLMSIINDARLDITSTKLIKPRYDKLWLIALDIFDNITKYYKTKDNKTLELVLLDYISITSLLNIEVEELMDSYNRKNEINRIRQKSNY